MPARVSSPMSRHSLPWRTAATRQPTGIETMSASIDHVAADREVRADDHQRTHQHEDQRDAQRPELVLERRRRVEVAAAQADQAEDDDRRAAQRHEVQPDRDGQAERQQGEGVGLALGQPALDDGVAGPRAGDRVDALPDVVDLVDDVGARVEQDGAEQGGHERRPGEPAVDRGQGRPGRHRDDRHGIGERAQDLPDRPGPAPNVRAGAEPAVVGQADPPIAPVVAHACIRTGADRGADDGRSPLGRSAAGRLGRGRVERRGSAQLVDLAILLEDRLEERQSRGQPRCGRPAPWPPRPRACRTA